MKSLFKFFLFVCILLTAGPVQRLQSSPVYKTNAFFNLNQQEIGFNNTNITPVVPLEDSRVFQLIEDEEDNISSRVKKSGQYASLILIFLSAGALLSIIQSLVRTQINNRLLDLNHRHRYIQLCTIRI